MDAIKQRLIELVPDLFSEVCPTCGYDGLWNAPYTEDKGIRPITLADVLRAIEKAYKPKYESYSVVCTPDGTIEVIDWGGGYEPAVGQESCDWNLAEIWDNQSDATKAFVGKLVGVEGREV